MGKYFLSEEEWKSGGLGDEMGLLLHLEELRLPIMVIMIIIVFRSTFGMVLLLHLEELRLTIGLVVIILFIISGKWDNRCNCMERINKEVNLFKTKLGKLKPSDMF